MAAVRILKLVTGEDVIGVVEEEEVEKGRKVISVKAPHYIMMKASGETQNEFVLGLTPYAPYAKNAVIGLIPRHVISVCDPNDDLMKAYKARFENGVVTSNEPAVKEVLMEG